MFYGILRAFSLFAFFLVLGGCSDDPGTVTPMTDESTPQLCADGVDNDSDGLIDCNDLGCEPLSVCASRSTGTVDIAGCSANTFRANTQVPQTDVIWAIDSSRSMSEELSEIETKFNQLATDLIQAQIDVRWTVITAAGTLQPPTVFAANPDAFQVLGRAVGPEQALQVLLSAYGEYSPRLRPGAALHFVAVSNNDSSLAASAFESQMQALSNRVFRAHAIASPPGSMYCPFGNCENGQFDGCSGPFGNAVRNGNEYWALAASTGGEQLSICLDDWTSLFSRLSAAVANQPATSCDFRVPAVGETFNAQKTNFIIRTADGNTQTVPFVDNATACTAAGWYFSTDETTTSSVITTCPATCDLIRSNPNAQIDVAIGCDRVLQ